MEKKIVSIHIIPPSQRRDGAILANHFGDKIRARIILILIGFLCFEAGVLSAAETAKTQNAFQKIMAVEKRGVVNFLSSPAELFYAFKGEKQDHPKAWPLTYIPSFFMKAAVRVGSSANDLVVLPWYVAASDSTPLTRRFDLPDYVWQKE